MINLNIKNLMVLAFVLCTSTIFGQKFRVDAPSSISGAKQFDFAEAASGWGNVAITQNYINIPVEVVNDGSASPYQGCGTLTNTSLTGKAALVFRGTCEFGVKALNAQAKGASFVIIVNNDPLGVVGMAGGTQGVNVNIPVISIGLNDGNAILNKLMASTPVTVSLSNWNFGANYDFTLTRPVLPAFLTIPSYLLNSISGNTDYSYMSTQNTGAVFNNYSSLSVDTVSFLSNIMQGTTVMFADTMATLDSVSTLDSLAGLVFTGATNTFDLSTLSKGSYTATVGVFPEQGAGDAYVGDNIRTVKYNVSDSFMSRVQTDGSGNPIFDYTFNPVALSEWGPILHIPYALNKKFKEVVAPIFLRTSAGVNDLAGKQVEVNVYSFSDANGDSAIQYSELTQIASNPYTFPTGTIVDSATRTYMAHIPILDINSGLADLAVADDGIYWVSIKLDGASLIGFGVDNASDNGRNSFPFLSDMNAPNSGLLPNILYTDNLYSGYSGLGAPAISVRFTEKPTATTNINKDLSFSVFPNPAKGKIFIDVVSNKNLDFVNYEIIDITGRVLNSGKANNVRNQSFEVNTSNLANGTYFVKVTTPEGNATQKLIKQ